MVLLLYSLQMFSSIQIYQWKYLKTIPFFHLEKFPVVISMLINGSEFLFLGQKFNFRSLLIFIYLESRGKKVVLNFLSNNNKYNIEDVDCWQEKSNTPKLCVF